VAKPQCFLGVVYAPEMLPIRGRSEFEERALAPLLLLSTKTLHCKDYTWLLALPPFPTTFTAEVSLGRVSQKSQP